MARLKSFSYNKNGNFESELFCRFPCRHNNDKIGTFIISEEVQIQYICSWMAVVYVTIVGFEHSTSVLRFNHPSRRLLEWTKDLLISYLFSKV
jgi:hypothetical protein